MTGKLNELIQIFIDKGFGELEAKKITYGIASYFTEDEIEVLKKAIKRLFDKQIIEKLFILKLFDTSNVEVS